MEHKTEEGLITAWVQLTGVLKKTSFTMGLGYNESIVMVVAYRT